MLSGGDRSLATGRTESKHPYRYDELDVLERSELETSAEYIGVLRLRIAFRKRNAILRSG